ncbi:YkvA family protein [Methanothermobacter sp.]|uniref:YkvA family protein n=1 Tax=Methanothermobacter sp. TaxID=1884223 RepID=UPI0026058737|nr:YkvA family protein [Methanothermobacter sp.]MDI9615146.1 YkvA family protein [Methanothermobacter sp.]
MDFTHFYDVLRDNINSYRGEYERIVDYAPDLFRLLADVLRSDELLGEERLRISAAMGYLVAPYDVIPEEIYGPHGYIDDVYLCAVVVDELASRHGYAFLEEHWAGDEELESVIEECLERASEILGEKRGEILSYAGFR